MPLASLRFLCHRLGFAQTMGAVRIANRRFNIFAAAVLLSTSVSFHAGAQVGEARESAGVSGATQGTGISMPRPDLTPGAIRTTDATELCAKSFRTKKYRIATEETKKKVCAAYGVADCPKKGKMELDDLEPLEIGGQNIEANLWVQMAPEYHWKDALENRLRKMICSNPPQITVEQAQQEIRTDWVAAYRKYVGELPGK